MLTVALALIEAKYCVSFKFLYIATFLLDYAIAGIVEEVLTKGRK